MGGWGQTVPRVVSGYVAIVAEGDASAVAYLGSTGVFMLRDLILGEALRGSRARVARRGYGPRVRRLPHARPGPGRRRRLRVRRADIGGRPPG